MANAGEIAGVPIVLVLIPIVTLIHVVPPSVDVYSASPPVNRVRSTPYCGETAMPPVGAVNTRVQVRPPSIDLATAPPQAKRVLSTAKLGE